MKAEIIFHEDNQLTKTQHNLCQVTDKDDRIMAQYIQGQCVKDEQKNNNHAT